MEIQMNSTRKFVYAALLAVTSLNFPPGLASAQEAAHGKFTLKHDVRWQNALVPAGEYRFSLDPEGASGLLTLSKLDGSRTGFLMMVTDTDEMTGSGPSLLVLETTAQGSYVSAMELPGFGVTLHFRVPSEATEKQIAKAVTATTAGAQ
jgi:hypothetical protein